LFFVTAPITFLWDPSLYFYAKSLIYKKINFKWQQLAHLIPLTIYSVVLTFRFFIFSAEEKRQLFCLKAFWNFGFDLTL